MWLRSVSTSATSTPSWLSSVSVGHKNIQKLTFHQQINFKPFELLVWDFWGDNGPVSAQIKECRNPAVSHTGHILLKVLDISSLKSVINIILELTNQFKFTT